MALKAHTVYESNIDLRKIKCSCNHPNCRIGISFDSTDEHEVMLLTDKYGNDHGMHLDKKNVKKLIASLKSYL